MAEFIELYDSVLNKRTKDAFRIANVSSIDPLQIKLYPSDTAIPANSITGLIGLKVGSTVIMVYYKDKFTIIGVIGDTVNAKCSLIKNSAQTISTSTTTKVTFSSSNVDSDPSSMFDDSNDRIIVPVDGLYEISMGGRWATGGANSDRAMYAQVNGSSVYADMRSVGSSGRGGNAVSIKKMLSANDYIEMSVWQDSGGDRQIGGTSFYTLYFSVEKCL